MNRNHVLSFVWAGAYVLLMLASVTLFLPITLCLIMVPLVALVVRETPLRFLAYYVPATAIAFFLSGPAGGFLLLLSLFFLPTTLIMGTLYKKQKAAQTVITAGVLGLLGEMLLMLLIIYAMGENLIGQFRELMQAYFRSAQPLVQGVMPGVDEELYLDMLISSIPTLMIISAVFFAFVTHGVGRKLMSLTGTEVVRLKPIREWMLPKSFVWIYLVVLIGNLVIEPDKSVVSMLIMNLYPLLLLAFSVQAISFLFYVSHVNNWGRTLPIVGIVVAIFLPFIFIYSFLGLLDVAFPLREKFRKKN